MAEATRTVRLALGPGSIAILIGGVAAGWFLFGVVTAARGPLAWAVAALVVATILEPIVSVLAARVPRVLAVVLVFLVVGGAAGALTFGVLHDLDAQVGRLKEAAPEAAAELAAGDGLVASLAEDIDLEERVERVVAELEEPSSGVAAGAADSVGGWLVGTVLTLFLLSWAPRLLDGALRQVPDPRRRRRAEETLDVAVGLGRRYLLGTLGLAMASGAVASIACTLEGVPAPVALGLAVAAGSVVPGVGVMIGALPAILLEAGLGTNAGSLRLVLVFLTVQLAHEVALRRFVTPRSLVVGPAVIVIGLVLGFDVYGVGGAYYAAALAVFGVAAVDAVARDRTARSGLLTPSTW